MTCSQCNSFAQPFVFTLSLLFHCCYMAPFCHDSPFLCPVFMSINIYLIQPIGIFSAAFLFLCFAVSLSHCPVHLWHRAFCPYGNLCTLGWPRMLAMTTGLAHLLIHLVQWSKHELVAFPFTSFSFSWVLSFVTVVNCGTLLHASCDWFCYRSFHMAAAIAGRRRGERCPTKNFLDCLSILLHEA